MQAPLAFSDIFDADFRHKLNKAEKLRKQILINYSVISLVILIGFALEAVTWMSIGIAVVIVFVLAYTHRFGISKSEFIKTYQSIIGRHFAITLNGGINYDYDRYHKLKVLNDAYLISGFPKQYGGKHLSSFMYGEIACGISEIESHTNKKNANGMHENFQIFNGLVGFAEIKIPISEPCLVMSDNSISENFSLIDFTFQNSIKKEAFTVYNGDNEYLNKLISPSIWLLLIRYLEKCNKGLFISITKTGFCVAVENPGFLNVSIFHNVYRKQEIEKFYEAFQFINTILQLVCKQYQETVKHIKT